jgi:hypothetical protein
MVPHNVAGLITTFGGDRPVMSRLDTFFTKLNAGTKEPYAFFGNEPNANIPWLYAFAGATYHDAGDRQAAMNEWYSPASEGHRRQRRPRPAVVVVRVGRARHVPGDPGPRRDGAQLAVVRQSRGHHQDRQNHHDQR